MKQVPKTPNELTGHLMPLLDNFREQRVEGTEAARLPGGLVALGLVPELGVVRLNHFTPALKLPLPLRFDHGSLGATVQLGDGLDEHHGVVGHADEVGLAGARAAGRAARTPSLVLAEFLLAHVEDFLDAPAQEIEQGDHARAQLALGAEELIDRPRLQALKVTRR